MAPGTDLLVCRAPTHPAVMADQLLALVAGVGEVCVVAGDAVWAIVHLDVLAPI